MKFAAKFSVKVQARYTVRFNGMLLSECERVFGEVLQLQNEVHNGSLKARGIFMYYHSKRGLNSSQ